MLCDNILPNLNMSRLVIDRLYTDVKITYNTKMIHIMVSFSDYQNSIFIDWVPYKHQNWHIHGIISTPLQVTRWNIQNSALKKDITRIETND